MKIPETWLYEWIEPTGSLEQIAHELTMAGLEVEQLSPVAEAFHEVIVAQVINKTKHPNADRLNVCQVDIGQNELVQIVCGAPNVVEGMKVPCAIPGAVLPGDFKIKQSKIRDVASSGMLCSAQELGLESDVDGLWILPDDAPIGVSVRDYLALDEQVMTLKVTPNRGDCLSIRGVAREVAAVTDSPFKDMTIPVFKADEKTASPVSVTIHPDAQKACPLYSLRVFKNINPSAKTPQWMADRLTRAGLRTIYPLVDITNYVMLELGQPLHAFDQDQLKGDIQVRLGRAGEKLVLLDEREVDCEGLLVIADDQQAVALGGVMGGLESGVTEKTTQMVLEAAFFDPVIVATAARRLGIDSDAAYRFERGVDFGQTLKALDRASQLIQEICGGNSYEAVIAEQTLPVRPVIALRLGRLNSILGITLDVSTVSGIFDRLGFCYTVDNETFQVSPPTHRFDLSIEVDLIEEVARIYGYDRITVPTPMAPLNLLEVPERQRSLYDIKTVMVSLGYLEAINFSFIDAEIERTVLKNADPVEIVNPIASHLTVMRSSLIGSLLLDLTHNLNRKQSRVRLFEVGRCFLKEAAEDAEIAGIRQPVRIAGIAYGSVDLEQWGTPPRFVDFFDIKGDVEMLLPEEKTYSFQPATHPALHPGRTAGIWDGPKQIGIIGELHPKWQQHYRIPHAPVLFEIDYEAIAQRSLPAFQPISKFQPISRDLAFIVPETVSADQLMCALRSTALSLPVEITLFDRYTGVGVAEGHKSLAYRMVFQADENVTEDVIEQALNGLVEVAAQTCGATLRS